MSLLGSIDDRFVLVDLGEIAVVMQMVHVLLGSRILHGASGGRVGTGVCAEVLVGNSSVGCTEGAGSRRVDRVHSVHCGNVAALETIVHAWATC